MSNQLLQDTFKKVKEQIDAREYVKKILGEPPVTSGKSIKYNSPFNKDDKTPSFSVEEMLIGDFSSNSTFGKKQDIFDFIVEYNKLTHAISEENLNYVDALELVIKEYELDVQIPNFAYFPSYNRTKTKKYSALELSDGTPTTITTMFDSVSFATKPIGKEAGAIKNRIPSLTQEEYTLEEIEDNIINGYTCIPAGIARAEEWADNVNKMQMFLIDIDNTAKVDGEKQSYCVGDEKHIDIDKMISYCESINLKPTFIYYSFSNSEKQARFRLVYVLDEPLQDKKQIDEIYNFLKEKFKNCNIDTAPTSIASLFYGGQSIAYTSNCYYKAVHKIEEDIDTDIADVIKRALGRRYFIKYGYLCERKKDNTYIKISNFIPFVSEKITIENGKEPEINYRIEGILLDKPDIDLPTLTIDANSYRRFDFVMGSVWDKYAIICSTQKAQDKLREFTQNVSRDTMEEKKVYAHTGMRRINDKLCFLHGNGAIGIKADGNVGNLEDIEVDLSRDNLERYKFTNKVFDIEEALKLSYSMLDLAEHSITVPLIATTYLAPIYSLLKDEDINADFIIYIQGPSGCRKSSTTGAFLSHYGKFNRDNFPCSFRDSLNTIEKKAYILKDMVLVLDDYNPEVNGARKLDIIEKAFAMFGDRVGRGRMTQDGKTLKSPFTARGLCIATGEVLPEVAQSRLARSLIVNIKSDSIRLDKLSHIQDNIEKLSYCMKTYIEMVIHNEKKIRSEAKRLFREHREKQNNSNVHGRTNEIVNVLLIGYYFFLNFMKAYKIIEETEFNNLYAEAEEIFKKYVIEQSQELVELKPTELFLSAIRQLCSVGKIYIEDYETHNKAFGSFNGVKVGYYDEKALQFYFIPNIIYNEVVEFYRKGNQKFPVSAKSLWNYLKEDGYLYTTDPHRKTIQRSGETVIAVKRQQKQFGKLSGNFPI